MSAAQRLLLVGAALFVARVALAAQVDLCGDEAFYWMCGQRLAPAYSDHPGMTALLVRGGTALLGDTPLGVRLLFLACGALLPAVLYALARPLVGRTDALLAAAFSLALPMLAATSMLATPDAPLLLFAALTLLGVERATRTGALRWWAAAGLAGAAGLCTHYRFSLVLLAALAYLALTRAGRRHARTPGPWLAATLAGAGLLPLLLFNLEHDFAPLRYQLHERHAEAPGLAAWWRHVLVEQPIAVSPLLYVALLAGGALALRRLRAGDDRAALLASFALLPLAIYFGTAPVSDAGHNHWHWPQVGYLPLLVLLPGLLRSWRQSGGLGRAAAWLAPVLGLSMLAAAQLDLATGWPGWTPRGAFVGWHELAAAARAGLPASRLVVADNYVTTSQLAFELGDSAEVYTLDHPTNRRHGRALQFRLWGLDESALALRVGDEALLVLDLAETRRRERTDWKARVLRSFENLQPLPAPVVEGRPLQLGRGALVSATGDRQPGS